MFLESISGVAIGLILTWFVLSIATVHIQEWIASLTQWRANDLQKAIRGMFCSENLMGLFYDHPIIRGFSLGYKNRDSKPSYIPANQFSTVLLSILQGSVNESGFLIFGLYGIPAALHKIGPGKRRKRAREDLNRIFEMARLANAAQEDKPLSDLFLVTMEKKIIELGEHYPELRKTTQTLIDDARVNRTKLENSLKLVPDLINLPAQTRSLLSGALALGVVDPEMKTAINALFLGAERLNQDPSAFLQQVRSNIETWFNDSMDRISGWYKRKAQLSTLLIGVVLASLFNIDSPYLAMQLWREPVLRDVLTNNANLILSKYADENGGLNVQAISTIQFFQDQYLNLPLGWHFSKVDLLTAQQCSFFPSPREVFGFSTRKGCIRPLNAHETTNGYLWSFYKILGFLITGFASAQGSSFWFDLLSKIVNIRSTGIKPA